LYGMSLVYGATGGALDITRVAEVIQNGVENPKVLVVGLVFIIAGISFKLSVAPFHMWVPDVYHGAPTAVVLFIGSAPKIAAFGFIMRLLVEGMGWMVADWQGMFIIIAVLSMLVGNLAAIVQTNIKRMLAYSSVAQIGYIVLGIGLANTMGLTGGLLHLVGHAFMKACLFLVAGSIVYRTGLRQIREFRYLSVKMPWTSAIFVVAAFSMIGIPPTTGFFSKLYLTLGAIDDERWIFVAVILISSILALMYFMNVIRYMYLPEEKVTTEGSTQKLTSSQPIFDEAPLTMLIPMGILAVLIIVLGLFNGEIVSSFIDPAISTRIR